MQFLTNLLTKYSELDIPNVFAEISKIDSHVSWYLGDQNKQLITIKSSSNKNIIELDIKRAFPTICNLLYNDNKEFVEKMNSISDKKKRNIFIATTLSGKELRRLNYICKCIIMGVFLENCNPDNDMILEIKKDGMIITCCDETLFNIQNFESSNNNFTSFIMNNNFVFHINKIYKYIRSNRTTWILKSDQNVKIKGIYKHIPEYLHNIINNILLENINNIDFDQLKKIYSKKYYKILLLNNIYELIERYYICENGKILDMNGRYTKFTKTVRLNPFNYLQTFIFPGLISLKL